MFAKPFNLILVYILSIFNFIILLLPILALALPFIDFEGGKIVTSSKVIYSLQNVLILLIFIVSFLMLIYLILDMIFGFSHRSSLAGCKRYDKLKTYEFLKEIFEQTKQRFGEKGVNLYIKNSDEINAFAIGSLGRKSIALTVGLIQHYHNSSEDEEEFLSTLRSIIGHEMSHLVNKDFLPALLIITNQKVTNFVSHILHMILNLVSYIFSFSRTNGIISDIFLRLYGIINWILCAFNNLVVYNIYEFLRKFVSRSIEYRCDRQSAQAFGGYNMALALSFLGKSGYFTLFSTHPATQRRVKKVENIKIKKGIIRPSISSSIANFISLMLLVTICAIAAKEAKVDLWVRYYLENPQELGRLIQPVKKLYLKFF